MPAEHLRHGGRSARLPFPLAHVLPATKQKSSMPMPLPLYLGFITAAVVLMPIPGPNVSLIVANSIAYGTRYGLLNIGRHQRRHGAAAWADSARAYRIARGACHVVRVAALARRGLSGLAGRAAMARGAAGPHPHAAAATLGSRDCAARLPDLAHQSEDAAVLWRLLPAIHRARPADRTRNWRCCAAVSSSSPSRSTPAGRWRPGAPAACWRCVAGCATGCPAGS